MRRTLTGTKGIGLPLKEWTEKEDRVLLELTSSEKANWAKVASKFENRSAIECYKRYKHLQDNQLCPLKCLKNDEFVAELKEMFVGYYFLNLKGFKAIRANFCVKCKDHLKREFRRLAQSS